MGNNISINATQTTILPVRVEVSKEELLHTVSKCTDISVNDIVNTIRTKLLRQWKLSDDVFIRNSEWWCKREVPAFSHGWDKDVYVRDVTEQEQAALESLGEFRATLLVEALK